MAPTPTPQEQALLDEDERRIQHHLEGAASGSPYISYFDETADMPDDYWENLLTGGWDR